MRSTCPEDAFGTNAARHPHAILPRLLLVPVLLALAVVAAVLIVRLHGGTSSSSVVHGTGIEAAQVRPVPPFRGVELAGALPVVVHAGSARRVVVTADANLIGRVTTRVVGGVLVVGTNGGFQTKARMRVEVTAPSVSSLELSGAGTLVATGIRAKALRVSLPGAGSLTADGAVTRLKVDVAGAGAIHLGALQARDAAVHVSGTGSVVVRASRLLDAEVSGTGSVVYLGAPARVITQITGLGAVNQG